MRAEGGGRIHDLLTAACRQKVKFIDEGNLYRLMAGSRLPSAERFESWILDELVSRTLKEGGYLLEKENALNTLKLNLRAPKVHYFDRVLRSSST